MTVKIKDTDHYKDGQKKAGEKRAAKKAARAPLGKAFSQLSDPEKDDLLKALAIINGLVEE